MWTLRSSDSIHEYNVIPRSSRMNINRYDFPIVTLIRQYRFQTWALLSVWNVQPLQPPQFGKEPVCISKIFYCSPSLLNWIEKGPYWIGTEIMIPINIHVGKLNFIKLLLRILDWCLYCLENFRNLTQNIATQW